MKLIDLFHQDVPGLPGKDDESPLFVEEVFEDAQLLDVRIHALHSVVGILFELRTGNLPRYVDDKSINCGVLMLRRATAVAWQGELTDWTGPAPWPVCSVLSNIHNGRYELSLEMGVIKGMTLQLAALKAEFYAGVLPTLTEGIPDYPEHEDVTGLVPGWDMDFIPVLGWYVDATK